MKVTRSQSQTLNTALKTWAQSGVIDESKAQSLQQTIEIETFDWKRLAKYSVILAMICAACAVGAALADEALRELLSAIFNAPPTLRCLGLIALSALIYFLAFKRRRAHPTKIFTNEFLLFGGAIATAGAIYNFGLAIDTGTGHYAPLILLTSVIFFLISYAFESVSLWSLAVLCLGAWIDRETAYNARVEDYFLGLNDLIRFVIFGAVAIGLSRVMTRKPRLRVFATATMTMGLFYFFVSLWALSIVGNESFTAHQTPSSLELMIWAALLAMAAGAAIILGLRTENTVARAFGFTFLIIDVLTQYFVHIWEKLPSEASFILLALFFWLIGSRAEMIWKLGTRPQNPADKILN